MRDRNAVNPLQQLKALSGNPGAFTFVPANDPTGQPVSPSVLSTTPDESGLGGLMLSIDGGAPFKDTTPIDHTAVNGNQLEPNHVYTWSGYLYVPTSDTYTFAIQQSDTLPTTLNCPQTGQFGSTVTDPVQTLCTAVHQRQRIADQHPAGRGVVQLRRRRAEPERGHCQHLRRVGAVEPDERGLHRPADDQPHLRDRQCGAATRNDELHRGPVQPGRRHVPPDQHHRQHQHLRVHACGGFFGRQSHGAGGPRALRVHELPLRPHAGDR